MSRTLHCALVLLGVAGCAGETSMPWAFDAAGIYFDGSIILVDSVVQFDSKVSSPKDGGPPHKADAPTADAYVAPRPDLKLPTGGGNVGDPCTSNSQCKGRICARNTHTNVTFCTKPCNPCTTTPCPSGSGCQNAGFTYICAPKYPNAPCPTP